VTEVGEEQEERGVEVMREVESNFFFLHPRFVFPPSPKFFLPPSPKCLLRPSP